MWSMTDRKAVLGRPGTRNQELDPFSRKGLAGDLQKPAFLSPVFQAATVG